LLLISKGFSGEPPAEQVSCRGLPPSLGFKALATAATVDPTLLSVSAPCITLSMYLAVYLCASQQAA
jgi:hypothetical protein